MNRFFCRKGCPFPQSVLYLCIFAEKGGPFLSLYCIYAFDHNNVMHTYIVSPEGPVLIILLA